MKDIKYYGIKPKKIIGPDGEVVFPYHVNSVILPSGFTVTATIANGSFSGPSEILENHEAAGLITPNEGYSLPSSITVSGATSQYDQDTGEVTISNPTSDVTIEATCPVASYPITVSVTGGIYSAPESIQAGGTATVTISADDGFIFPSSVTVTGADFTYNGDTGVISLSNPTGSVSVTAVCVEINETLENNSWETIRKVCEAGQAANYWSLGDSKNVTGADGYTRPVKLVHMGDIYNGKKAVFQYWYRTENNYVWDAGGSNAVADADIFPMLNVGGDIYVALMGSELHTQLGLSGDTTVQVSTSGQDATLTTITGKLFLPAEKEITATRAYSSTTEFDALTTFGYYAANDNNATRVKHKASAPEATTDQAYWTRSPYGGSSNLVVGVYSLGGFDNFSASNAGYGVAPCFAF